MPLKIREFFVNFHTYIFGQKCLAPNADRAPAPMLIVQLVRSLKYLLYAMITGQSINQSVNQSALVAGLLPG